VASVEFLVKLRDAAQMIADAANEYLESLIPPEGREWDPNKIKWQRAEGPAGPYERASAKENKDNSDFEAMLADLQEHKGKLTRLGYFYWKFTNGEDVGRKKCS